MRFLLRDYKPQIHLIRVYWNSWFYLLTNLSLSLFDVDYYSFSSFSFRHSVHSLSQVIAETFHIFFYLTLILFPTFQTVFLSLCLNSSFTPVINNSFNQLFQNLLVCVFEHTCNHVFEFFF